MINWKWFYPGLKIKRWVLTICLGLMTLIIGTVCLAFGLVADPPMVNGEISLQGPLLKGALVFIPLGLVTVLYGVYGLVKSIEDLYAKSTNSKKGIFQLAYEQRGLSKGPQIVAFGGGTGMHNLLSGLKEYTTEITAITTVADDGGSSGRLRSELDIPPPGDIRNCLVALAESESLMRDIMQYRFSESELQGHSFGNLFLAVLAKVSGDFSTGVQEAHRILSVRGRVFPIVPKKLTLEAIHPDGTKTTGQHAISECTKEIVKVRLNPPPGRVSPVILEAIAKADMIIYGPGSLFTSIIPNLIVDGVEDALSQAKGIRIYICNTMTQKGETMGYSVEDHVKAIERHINSKIIDIVLVNNGEISDTQRERYKTAGCEPVNIKEPGYLEKAGYRVVEADVVSDSEFVRHHPHKLSRVLMDILQNGN